MRRIISVIFAAVVIATSVPLPVQTPERLFLPIVDVDNASKSPKAGFAWAFFGRRGPGDENILGASWYFVWTIARQQNDVDAEYIPYFSCDTFPYNGGADMFQTAHDILGSDYDGYLMWLNEPDLTGQCYRSPLNSVLMLSRIRTEFPNAIIVGPAPSHMDYMLGWPWMRQFYSIGNSFGVRMPEIGAVHTYIGKSVATSYISLMQQYGGSGDVWITEFGSCNPYISESMLNEFSSNDRVKRYAWFSPRSYYSASPTDQCLALFKPNGHSLTKNGQLYLEYR